MAHPENQQQDDDDGGTFKLKPGAQSQPGPPRSESEEGLDSTMKLRKADMSSAPPPPSPLGNPTGSSNPPSPFADTSVMPQSGGSQTNFQPATQMPGQPNPLGQPAPPQQQGQPYGQQPGGQPPYGRQQPPQAQYQPQQQQPGGQQYGQGQPGAAAGAAPAGIKRIGLLGLISGAAGLLYVILLFVLSGGGGLVFISVLPYIVTSLAVLGAAFALPRGLLHSKGLRTTSVIVMMVHGGWSLIVLLNLLSVAGVLNGAFVAIGSGLLLAVAGASGYGAFVYFKDQEAHAWIKSASTPQQSAGAVPPPAQPGYGVQQPGGPQTGAYPPPGHPQQGQQGQQQPPYGR